MVKFSDRHTHPNAAKITWKMEDVCKAYSVIRVFLQSIILFSPSNAESSFPPCRESFVCKNHHRKTGQFSPAGSEGVREAEFFCGVRTCLFCAIIVGLVKMLQNHVNRNNCALWTQRQPNVYGS